MIRSASQTVSQTVLAAIAVLAPVTVAAQDCHVYEVPDFCSVLWLTEAEFWTGQYQVAAGPVAMMINGQPMARPAEPLVEATVFQVGRDLAISHPEGMLEAEYQPLDPGDDPFVWPQNLGGTDVLGNSIIFDMADFEDALGCSNQEMPRWQAAVPVPDGPVATVELTAVSFDTILGRLYYEGPWQDAHIWFERRVQMTRPGAEIEPSAYPDLFPVVAASGETCEQVCGEAQSWVCAD